MLGLLLSSWQISPVMKMKCFEMGIEKCVFIGAYLEIDADKIIKTKKEIVCLNCNEIRSENYKYCQVCGNSLTAKFSNIEQNATLYTLLPEEKYADILFQPLEVAFETDKILLIGNQSNIDLQDRFNDNEKWCEITKYTIETFVRNFYKNYNDIIRILEKRVNKIDVKFGFIEYYL
jgi:hypothetical protein